MADSIGSTYDPHTGNQTSTAAKKQAFVPLGKASHSKISQLLANNPFQKTTPKS